jgi:hypothetical protein
MDKAPSRRRSLKIRTARGESAHACAAHLRDLRRVHGQIPPAVPLPQRSVPARVSPEPTGSYCTSPGQLCAELAQ